MDKSRRKHRPRKGRFYSPPEWSGRLYVRIDSGQVHMFRYLLEAEDNLGMMTVVDRWGAVLLVRFSPHQSREVLEYLHGMKSSLAFDILSSCTVDNE